MNAHLLFHLAAGLLAPAVALVALVAWPMGRRLPPLPSLAQAAQRGDFSRLPTLSFWPARDGTALAYRAYAPLGEARRVAVLVHGSSGDGRNMHRVGLALAARGVAAYALDMRGHGASGRRGDVDYVGQLDDDLADVVGVLQRLHPGLPLAMVGLSSGGGFTLRTAAGPLGEVFDRFVMLAPMLHHKAPTARPLSGGWARPNLPRIVGLTILERLGLRWFQHLPVLQFALPPEAAADRTLTYSYRLQRSFRPHDDYQADLRAVRRPGTVIVGERDEIFRADQYPPLLAAFQPLLAVRVLPGLTHLEVVVDDGAIAVAVAAALGEPGA